MTVARSSRAEVRNPVLALPSAWQIHHAGPETRALLRRLLLDLSVDAKDKAERAWRRHKGPMAAYWRSVAVYARHIAAALRRAKEPPA